MRLLRAFPALVLVATFYGVLADPALAASANTTFTTPQYVDATRAGGEPVMVNTGSHGTLVYSSHQGLTHLYRGGIGSLGTAEFLTTDRSEVFVWTSKDGGATWQFDNADDIGATCSVTVPCVGFSDPDLTLDSGGRAYDTGIDLVNDALFSSSDGGKTWNQGTTNCHDGDRPWLAGGSANQVFMATDTVEGVLSHQIFVSNDGGSTCSSGGVPDTDGSTYSGDGKIQVDKTNGNLVEPAIFFDSSGNVNGVGVSVAGSYGKPFVPHEAASGTTLFAHWPSLAIDAGGNYYLVWDTDERAGDGAGCNGTGTALPNSVQLAISSDRGATWKQFTVARPGNVRVLWPWVVAGDAGKASVVWYQRSNVLDPDCNTGSTYVEEAQVFGLGSSIRPVNASGRSIHEGSICQAGTDCVVNGKDRRLGDFFTNAIDLRGCVVIATGDTELTDPLGNQLVTSRPLFIRQISGPQLVGSGNCTT
jgi:hypothetical protein